MIEEQPEEELVSEDRSKFTSTWKSIVESVSHLKQCWLDDGAWVTVHVWQWDPQLDEIRNLETVGTGEHVLSVLLTNRWSAPHYSLLVDK